MSVATVMARCVGIERSRLCGDMPARESGLKARVDERATWNLWANMSRVEMFRQCFRDSAYHRGRILARAGSLHLGDTPLTDYLRYPAHRAC